MSETANIVTIENLTSVLSNIELTNSLITCVSAADSLETVWTQIRPDKTSDLIWIQTV